MKAAKECCRRTFCARSLIFMASASIIFWNELIKRTKTTADAVVFSIKMWRAQQRRLGRHSRNGIIQSRRSAHWKCRGVDNPKGRGKAPPFWSLGVQGRSRNAPAVLLGDLKGAFSHVRERPLCPVQRQRRCSSILPVIIPIRPAEDHALRARDKAQRLPDQRLIEHQQRSSPAASWA